jgi:seryl-tRNA synthetase
MVKKEPDDFQKHLAKMMEDPEFKREYDALEDEYKEIQRKIDLKKNKPNKATKDAIKEVNEMVRDGDTKGVSIGELFDDLGI